MRLQKKRPIIIAAAGFSALGLLLFTQTSNEENGGNGDQSLVAIESPEKQRRKAVEIEGPKKVSWIKTRLDHNHIEYDMDSIETFDEMEIFDNSSAGIHLKEHFDLLENTEPGSQEKQDESFKKMRETPEVYVTKLAEAYDEVDRRNFLARYKVVYMMENLKSAHAIPFLSELANSEFPEVTAPYKGDGHIDEAHHESLIRMRAVGGLYTLANEGDKDARNSLFEAILSAKDRTVKNDAIWAYLSTSKDLEVDKEYLKTVLPDEDHQFVTLKLSNIEDVQEQVESNNENEHLGTGIK